MLPNNIQPIINNFFQSNKLKELWGGTVSSRPTSQPVTTRPPVWHRFTSTPSPWDQYVSQKAMSTQEVNDYHYINGQRIKIPDNVRWKYDLKRSHQIPTNMRQETQDRIHIKFQAKFLIWYMKNSFPRIGPRRLLPKMTSPNRRISLSKSLPSKMLF